MKRWVAMLGTCTLIAEPNLNAGTVASQALARPELSSPAGSSLDNAFGEQIDTRTGSAQFKVTDVSVKTNSGLPMSVGRKQVVGQRRLEQSSMGYFDNYPLSWVGRQRGRAFASEHTSNGNRHYPGSTSTPLPLHWSPAANGPPWSGCAHCMAAARPTPWAGWGQDATSAMPNSVALNVPLRAHA